MCSAPEPLPVKHLLISSEQQPQPPTIVLRHHLYLAHLLEKYYAVFRAGTSWGVVAEPRGVEQGPHHNWGGGVRAVEHLVTIVACEALHQKPLSQQGTLHT